MVSRKISVVTTFHQSGYEQYGRKMIDTFLLNWPSAIDLHVYAENCAVDQSADNLHVIDYETAVPALQAFKNRWSNDPRATGQLASGPPDKKGKQPGIGFKWDAVRFSHKIYAVCDLAKKQPHGTVVWMDADTVCHSPITVDVIDRLIPDSADIAFLGRKNKYTECGLYALNLNSAVTQQFIHQFQSVYDHAETGIFTMSEWHDSWVFDRVREKISESNPKWQQLDWSAGLINGEGHPLINSEWGAYLDHLKGKRKNSGRSLAKDLKVKRQEAYWQ
jgi:hypothetical protein